MGKDRTKKAVNKEVNPGRHSAQCAFCQHPHREDIEQQWIDWGNTSRLAEEYGLSRDGLYRHCHALHLFKKRQRNIRKALERMIEHAESVEVTASAVVSAIQAYAKINANGQWIDRVEGVSLNELFDRMSQDELEGYARDGTLPHWFSSLVVATPFDSQEGEDRD